MQKGDANQQQQSLTSDYSTATLLFNGAPASSSDGPNYNDIAKVLSQVELPSPSPSPVLPTSCCFQDGQSSGSKKIDEIKGNIEGEKELKDIHGNLQESGMQSQANVARTSRQRRRSVIHERIRVLKELVPNCNKRDQASILDDAIMHIKSLQMQVQMMQMGAGTTAPQGLYMPPGRHPSLQGPYIAPYIMMRPMDGVGYNMGHYGSYYNSVSPVFPPFGGGFHPPMPVGTGSPNLLPNPHLQCPSQTSEHVYSTTLSSDTIIAAGSQVGSGISSQSPYHMVPVTSHEDQ